MWRAAVVVGLVICLSIHTVNCGCTDSDWKATCRMASEVGTFNDLQKIATLNQVPFSTLDARALPQKQPNVQALQETDECIQECEMFIAGAGVNAMVGSFTGYMAKNEVTHFSAASSILTLHFLRQCVASWRRIGSSCTR